MTEPSNPEAQAAVQYLIWALDEIEKSGNREAAQHARRAIDALRRGSPPSNSTDHGGAKAIRRNR
jgi:hypothetical protein